MFIFNRALESFYLKLILNKISRKEKAQRNPHQFLNKFIIFIILLLLFKLFCYIYIVIKISKKAKELSFAN